MERLGASKLEGERVDLRGEKCDGMLYEANRQSKDIRD